MQLLHNFCRIPTAVLSIVLSIILLGSSPSIALSIPSQPDSLFSHLRRVRSLPGSLSTAPDGAVGENPPPEVAAPSTSGAARLIRDGPQLGIVLVLLLLVALMMRWMYTFVKRHKATTPSHGKLESFP